jgi:hypothetical protein
VDWAYDPEIGMDALSESVSYTTDKGSRAFANWNKVVHKKSHYFKKIVEMGYSVMVSDIDMVWLKNPFTAMGDSEYVPGSPLSSPSFENVELTHSLQQSRHLLHQRRQRSKQKRGYLWWPVLRKEP